MIETLTPAPDPQAASSHSLLERVRDTFVAPARLFGSFRRQAPWIDVLALATMVGAIAVAAEPAEFYLDQMENPVDRRGVPVEITSPPEQIVLWGRVMALFSALVGHPMLAFGLAGVLTLIFRVARGGEGSFREYLAIACHGLLILSLGMLVANGLRAFSGDAGLLPTAGSLAGLSPTGVLGAVLHGLNLFTLWMLATVGVGVAAIESRVTSWGATTLLWGGYLALTVTVALLVRG